MKVSEITIDEAIAYCNGYDDTKTRNDLSIILASVKAYIKSYTGLDNEGIDKYEDITLAALVLCNEMFDNRSYTVDKSKVNVVIESILNMHSINLL